MNFKAQIFCVLYRRCFSLSSIAVSSIVYLNIFLAAFPIHASDDGLKQRLELKMMLKEVQSQQINNEQKVLAMQGLTLLTENRIAEAVASFNAALKLDAANSYLHFFNAYAYHLMAKAGDSQKYELAEQGYLLAIQFDRSNWLAHFFLGSLFIEQRKYRAAKTHLAEVMLFRDDDGEVLAKMAAASYYSGDAATSAVCLNRLYLLDPQDSQVLRMLAVTHAAMGRNNEASLWLQRYQDRSPDPRELFNTRERIKHWNLIHLRSSASPTGKRDGADQSNATPLVERVPVQFSAPILPSNAVPMNSSNQSSVGTMNYQNNLGMLSAMAPPLPNPLSQRMVLVDVVLMYTTDQLSSYKGVNLLSALTLQFGSSVSPFYSRAYSRSSDLSGTTTVTRAISLPALTYSLNIVNSGTSVNEVLARPTLVALDGLKSVFFSGETLSAAAVSTGSNGGNAVQIEKELGVKLGITPVFQKDGSVMMTVAAERTHLQPASSDIGFTFKLSTTKLELNANVVMKFGETLVLGGLSEKEVSSGRNGVPVLQDIPGLQYFFSNKNTSNYQHSVLMLITPRIPQYTSTGDDSKLVSQAESMTDADDESMRELRARYGDWFSPYPNMASVFHQLGSSSIYREFRTGDVTLEKWDRQESLLLRLKQALEFLYY